MIVPGIIKPAKILLLGQAPAKEEEAMGFPFAGPAGRELDKWLGHAGIERRDCAITNLFNERLPDNSLDGLLQKEQTDLPPIRKGQYLKPEFEHHVERLKKEIAEVNPNIIIALGAEALWALNGRYEISRYRGALFTCKHGVKAIATFHPAYMLHGGGKLRTVAIADVLKARVNSAAPELTWTERELWLNPKITDLHIFQREHLDPAEMIFFDIETNLKLRQITHISFAPSRTVSLCIPFSWKGKSYWPTLEGEKAAVRFIRQVCDMPQPKCAQNGLYDIGWLYFHWGIRVRNYLHDTRLMSHALFPELPKDLGFLGTLWEDEQAWKMLGAHHQKGDD